MGVSDPIEYQIIQIPSTKNQVPSTKYQVLYKYQAPTSDRADGSQFRDFDYFKVVVWGHCNVALLHSDPLGAILMTCHPNGS